MTRDPGRSTSDPAGLDDAELGELIRAVTDDWQMPPQRLDQPTWRDRVGGRSGPRRRPGLLTRLVVPATTAIVATVLVAFAAVWLTAPRGGVGQAPPATGSPEAFASPGSSAPAGTASTEPRASTLTAVDLAPDPARILVRSGTAYRLVDLTTGEVEETPITPHDGSGTVLPRPGGGWVCVCFDWTVNANDPPTGVDVSLEAVDPAGGWSRSMIRTLRGKEDATAPRGPESTQLADARSVATPDGRSIFVGWSLRDGAAGWSAGIDVIDVATAAVVDRVALPVTALAERGPSYSVAAPSVAVSPSGSAILVSAPWSWRNGLMPPPSGTEHWTASFDGKTIGRLASSGGTANDRCDEFSSGLIDDRSYYALCWTPDGGFAVERVGTDGTAIGRTDVSAMDAGLDGGTQVARQGERLFLWEPFAGRLTRVDLRTGEARHTDAVAVIPAADDPLAALGRQLGRWLAPTALAKVFVDPGLVVSPDGRMVYALGIDTEPGGEIGGSRGIYVFDAGTLEQRAHWPPTADFVSLAIGPSGRFVYAAGIPGVDAGGKAAGMQASITVFDTADGSVRMIADRLGLTGIVFPEPPAR